MTRTILAVLLVAVPAVAVAQSSTATSGTTKPLQSAPASSNTQGGQKAVIPPAARSGEKGLAVGEGAVTGDNPVEIKRNK
jgi:hypothetical protein